MNLPTVCAFCWIFNDRNHERLGQCSYRSLGPCYNLTHYDRIFYNESIAEGLEHKHLTSKESDLDLSGLIGLLKVNTIFFAGKRLPFLFTLNLLT